MSRFILNCVLMVGLPFTLVTSCMHLKKTGANTVITQEVFDRLDPIEMCSYNGTGYISEGFQLGSNQLEISLGRAIFNPSLGVVTISGRVVDFGDKKGFSGIDILIGGVEYKNGRLFKFDPKKWVVSGENGTFTIKSKIEATDRLYVACLGYNVKSYNISKLLDPH